MKFLLTIVSVSLNEDIIESMDKLKSLGFSGRSDIIRAGIRNLLSDERMKEDLDGEINSLLLAVHDEDSDDRQVGIAIGHGLDSDLDDADHGNQHAKKPKPTDQQIRSSPP